MASSGGRGSGLFGYGGSGFEHVGDDEGLWSTRWAGIRASDLTKPSLGFPVKEDCEDYTAGLVKQIAKAMLQESEEQDCSLFHQPAQAILTSPQSIEVGMSWDVLSRGGSSSGGLSSGVSSPLTPVEALSTAALSHVEKDALDLLYAELLCLKMEDEIQARQKQLMQLKQQQGSQRLFWEIRQQQVDSISEASKQYGLSHGRARFSAPHNSFTPGYYSGNRARNEECSQIHGPKSAIGQNAAWSLDGVFQGYHSGAARQRIGATREFINSSREKHCDFHNHNCHSTAVNGPGMRAVFLGTPGARESSGTGVFLPRPIGGAGSSSADIRRKPACSTVLLPSHIVQVLNLNVEDTFSCPAVFSTPLNARKGPSLNKWTTAPIGPLSCSLPQDAVHSTEWKC